MKTKTIILKKGEILKIIAENNSDSKIIVTIYDDKLSVTISSTE